jgi:uncharacterized protein YndB with AHSA1/START domain
MIKAILTALVLVVLALLAFAATRPDSFRVERSARIEAPPEKIFPLIDNFHQWEKWSPWEKADPALKRTYSGSEHGVGAIYRWDGNKDVGQGQMEIIESTPPGKLRIKIDFMSPFEGHNTVEFTLEPQGSGTIVRHAMFGPSPYLSKLLGLFFNMDNMIGGKFEEGLVNLRSLAETR